MKKLFFILIAICIQPIAHTQTLQDVWKEVFVAIDSLDYVKAQRLCNIMIENAPTYGPAYYIRSVSRINLLDIQGACADATKATTLGIKEKLMPYTGFYCDEENLAKMLKKQFYTDTKIYPENNYRPNYTRKDTLRGALRPERTCYDVYFYDLNVKLITKKKKISGTNKIYFKIIEDTKEIQVDLFENMKITSITMGGNSLNYRREYDAVFISFPGNLAAGSNEMIEISYEGKPRKAPNPPWDGGFVWEKDEDKNPWYGVSCEHYGASSWWPTKDHLSDEPDSMSIRIEAPKPYKVICNGTLRSVEDTEDNYQRYNWFVHYPINNYNVTFYYGNFETIQDSVIYNNTKLDVDYYVLPYHKDTAISYFKQTLEVLDVYNEIYGPYPFWKDGYAHIESPYAGMEHQSAIAWGNEYGTNESRTYHNGLYDPIIVHEAAHEWWGNSLTAGDMAEVWLHESFATYSEILFIEKALDKIEATYELTDHHSYVFNFWPMIENFDVNENAFASSDVYMKGSAMLHSLRCAINNDDVFFKILYDFHEKYKYQVVNTQQFIDMVNEYCNDDYTPFFKTFLYKEKPPVLEYKVSQEGGNLVLKYRWSNCEKGFKMPFCIKPTNGENIRLEGSTTFKEVEISDDTSFKFYNYLYGTKGVDYGSFTYFWTKMVD